MNNSFDDFLNEVRLETKVNELFFVGEASSIFKLQLSRHVKAMSWRISFSYFDTIKNQNIMVYEFLPHSLEGLAGLINREPSTLYNLAQNYKDTLKQTSDILSLCVKSTAHKLIFSIEDNEVSFSEEYAVHDGLKINHLFDTKTFEEGLDLLVSRAFKEEIFTINEFLDLPHSSQDFIINLFHKISKNFDNDLKKEMLNQIILKEMPEKINSKLKNKI